MFTTVAFNYHSTLSAKNSYTNSPAYQSWILSQTTSSQDCGGTGCVASNYVPVMSSRTYSTAEGGTSISGPTVDQAAYQSSTITVSDVLDPALQNDPSAHGGSLPMCNGQPGMSCGEAAAMGVTGGLIIADFVLGYVTFLAPNLWTGYALGMSVEATFFAGGYTIDHGPSATGQGAIDEAEAGAADWYDRTDWILPFLPILGPLF
ncbi:MAG TPA: hypothetical protein VFF30_10955 [Nitrososphaerales archaeon]|nr:hypothetical protein [Nitrososphaerales archaeon]